MNNSLRLYLRLKRRMEALDKAGDHRADAVRDCMDQLWFTLTEKEHRWLDEKPKHKKRKCNKCLNGEHPCLYGIQRDNCGRVDIPWNQ